MNPRNQGGANLLIGGVQKEGGRKEEGGSERLPKRGRNGARVRGVFWGGTSKRGRAVKEKGSEGSGVPGEKANTKSEKKNMSRFGGAGSKWKGG